MITTDFKRQFANKIEKYSGKRVIFVSVTIIIAIMVLLTMAFSIFHAYYLSDPILATFLAIIGIIISIGIFVLQVILDKKTEAVIHRVDTIVSEQQRINQEKVDYLITDVLTPSYEQLEEHYRSFKDSFEKLNKASSLEKETYKRKLDVESKFFYEAIIDYTQSSRSVLSLLFIAYPKNPIFVEMHDLFIPELLESAKILSFSDYGEKEIEQVSRYLSHIKFFIAGMDKDPSEDRKTAVA